MAKTDQIVQDIYNLKIYEIKILGSSGEVYQIIPYASSLSYVSMEMVEGLFEASIVGKLMIRDLNSTMEQINFSGFEDLIVKMENPEIPNSYKSLRFKIYNVRATDDQIANNRIKEDVNVSNIKLEIQFCSYEHYLLTYREFTELAGLTGADIITKIASKTSNQDTPVGLVNMINNQFFKTGKTNTDTTQKEMFIEPTGNWIWYKQNQSLYPWGKLTRPIKASQLMQFLAEYAVGEENPNACNFLFWQDLDRWNFRSIESLLKEPTEREYEATNIPNQTKNIYTLETIQEANFLRLFETNAIASKYYLVEPKWDQPYREYLDYNESHSIKEISYDYFRDYYKWLKVEKYPIFDSEVDTKPTVANIINDNISGYFSPSYSNREKVVEWEHHGYTLSNRDGVVSWQPMFDQVDLDGEICKKIQKEIKQKIKDKKIEYANKKNLKEKWKVYRCSICCDTRYQDPTALEDIVFTPEYGVVAAGAFSDMVNYSGATGSTLSALFPAGLSLSYDFESEPFNKTIGELMYLRETPDIQTKYLYDLELKRIDIAKETIQNSITRLENAKQVANAIQICDPDQTIQFGYCEPSDTFAYTGEGGSECFCTQEKKADYLTKYYDDPIRNRQELLNSPYFDSMADIINAEKENFTRVYEEYKNRKAFFISNRIGFTADNSQKNLFNIKSITRVPIRGSKYEKLAHKSVLTQLASSLGSGVIADFKGFPAGATSYYPYEIFYNNDSTIDPKIKHPHYDSGYNFDIGYQVNPAFSLFDPAGGPDSGSAFDSDPYKLFLYYITLRVKTTTNTSSVTNFVPFDSFTSEYDCNATQTYNDSSTRTVFSNVSFNNTDPNKLKRDQVLSNLVADKLNRINIPQLEADGWTVTTEVNSNVLTVTQIKNIQCNLQNKIVTSYTFEYDTVYTNNNGNSYLSQFDPGICVLQPFGLERFEDFNPIDYLNSRNFIDVQAPTDNEEPKRPIETILEELESFVRVEFQKPIGTNTLYDFPKGFYDTPGSEYYLPYHILLTAGPFGTKSVDYNISVLGQDPYGFDVAVKRIKKKKQNLKAENKALVNNKDYHIIEKGYARRTFFGNNSTDSYLDSSAYRFTTENPLGYGNNIRIFNQSAYFSPYEFTSGSFYNNTLVQAIAGVNKKTDSDKNRIEFDNSGNALMHSSNFINGYVYGFGTLSEIFYHDLAQSVTRTNPLSLPTSYFEISNLRPFGSSSQNGLKKVDFTNSFATQPEKTIYSSNQGSGEYTSYQVNQQKDLETILIPGNVFGYYQTEKAEPLPISTDYFKSNISYYPNESKGVPWLAFFELDLKNRNDRVEPEDETAFYGYYYGSAIWQHPQLAGLTASVWKNDISGETEYGIVGPELEDEDSTFDRNFAAQFVVMSRENIQINSSCAGYPCSNPNPADNASCPDDNPLCNCPCQELRPDRLTMGITGPEPTFKELKDLEEEIKECTLIEEVLGEDWLGCVWGDPKNPLNCKCPCIGEKFLDYLKYSQTYCTFWNTPPERPLYRNAQMMQIISNKIAVKLNGDFTLRPGMKVKLNMGNKRYSGVWLVSAINHDIARTKHLMNVILIRDSESTNHDIRATKLKLNTQ